MTKTLTDLMNWRYATKKMDPAKAVPQEKVDAIVEAVQMAPTSSGTQPFELFVISNACLLYTSPSPRDQRGYRMPSSA